MLLGLALAATGTLALAQPGGAAVVRCGSVSYTVPGTHDEGHAALNNLVASGLPCAQARTVAASFLARHPLPRGWRGVYRTIVSDHETLGEEVLRRGAERIVGDLAN